MSSLKELDKWCYNPKWHGAAYCCDPSDVGRLQSQTTLCAKLAYLYPHRELLALKHGSADLLVFSIILRGLSRNILIQIVGRTSWYTIKHEDGWVDSNQLEAWRPSMEEHRDNN